MTSMLGHAPAVYGFVQVRLPETGAHGIWETQESRDGDVDVDNEALSGVIGAYSFQKRLPAPADWSISMSRGVTRPSLSPNRSIGRQCLLANHCIAANGLARVGHPISYCADLRLSFSRPSSGTFVAAAIPAARSFAIRLMSFTGTGLVSGKWTVPFRNS